MASAAGILAAIIALTMGLRGVDGSNFIPLGEGYLATEVATLKITTKMVPTLEEGSALLDTITQYRKLHHLNSFNDFHTAMTAGITDSRILQLCDGLYVGSYERLHKAVGQGQWLRDNLRPQRTDDRPKRSIMEWIMSLFGNMESPLDQQCT